MSDSREQWSPSRETIDKYRELGYSADEAYELALEEEFDLNTQANDLLDDTLDYEEEYD